MAALSNGSTATKYEATPLIASIAAQFQKMSAERDSFIPSKTEGHTFQVGNEVVQEVVSTSTPRKRPTGEEVTTVTRRRSSTSPTPFAATSAQQVNGTSPQPGSRPRSPLLKSLRPLPDSNVPASDNVKFAAAAPTVIVGASGRTLEPAPVMQWVKTPTRRRDDAAAQIRSGSKSVAFGGVDTRVVEPSRISPMHVEAVYAPVKYITRAELRRLTETHEQFNCLGAKVRSSSVPRLDSLYEQRMHAGRDFAPNGVPGRYDNGHRAQDEAPDYGEYMFRHQGPPQPLAGARRSTPPRLRYEAAPQPQPVEQYDQGPVYAQRRQPNYEEGEPFSQRPAEDIPDWSERHPELMHVASPQPAAPRQYYRSPASSRGSSRGSTPAAVRPYVAIVGPDRISVTQVASMLARMRGVSPPSAPPYAADAFVLLNRGTYLIKYPSTGNPHERFVAIRIIENELGVPHPYFVWALHNESTTVKERIHLSLLNQVERGVGAEGFARQLMSPTAIRGPYVGSNRAALPTTFAFTLVFRTPTICRLVNLLALDEQTYRCWLLVCDYFAAVNSAPEGAALPEGVEQMAPDTPRSRSSVATGQ